MYVNGNCTNVPCHTSLLSTMYIMSVAPTSCSVSAVLCQHPRVAEPPGVHFRPAVLTVVGRDRVQGRVGLVVDIYAEDLPSQAISVGEIEHSSIPLVISTKLAFGGCKRLNRCYLCLKK